MRKSPTYPSRCVAGVRSANDSFVGIEMKVLLMNLAEIVSKYCDHGYIRVRGFFKPEEVCEIREVIDRYVRHRLDALPDSDKVLENDGKSVRNLWRMEEHDRRVGSKHRRARTWPSWIKRGKTKLPMTIGRIRTNPMPRSRR